MPIVTDIVVGAIAAGTAIAGKHANEWGAKAQAKYDERKARKTEKEQSNESEEGE